MTLLTDENDLPQPTFSNTVHKDHGKHYPLRDEIRDACRKACNAMGGGALVDEHYAFVDLRVYEVSVK